MKNVINRGSINLLLVLTILLGCKEMDQGDSTVHLVTDNPFLLEMDSIRQIRNIVGQSGYVFCEPIRMYDSDVKLVCNAYEMIRMREIQDSLEFLHCDVYAGNSMPMEIFNCFEAVFDSTHNFDSLRFLSLVDHLNLKVSHLNPDLFDFPPILKKSEYDFEFVHHYPLRLVGDYFLFMTDFCDFYHADIERYNSVYKFLDTGRWERIGGLEGHVFIHYNYFYY